MIRILADLRHATQHWNRRSDKIPTLHVPMSDGSDIWYDPRIEQPAFRKCLEIIRNMKDPVVGYETKK